MRKQNKRHRKDRECINGPNFPGQHLIRNKQTIHSVVHYAHISCKDTVLEIGAGKGALTFLLAKKAGKVLAIENDPHFAKILRGKAQDHPNIKIIQKDFIIMHLPKESFSVVASIPYSITTPIFDKLFGQPTQALQQAVIVLEKGAAKRFTANPITNPRILKWRMWFDMSYEREISRHHFSPPPKVDSAVLIIRRKNKPMKHHSHFLGLAEYGLEYPHLPIYEALKGIFTARQMKHLCRHMGITRDRPIHSLNEHQWGVIFETMVNHVEPFRWPKRKKKK